MTDMSDINRANADVDQEEITKALNAFDKEVDALPEAPKGLFKSIARFFNAAFPGIVRLNQSLIPAKTRAFNNAVNTIISAPANALLNKYLDMFINWGLVSHETGETMRKYMTQSPTGSGILNAFMAIGSVLGLVKGGTAPFIAEVNYRLNEILHNQIPDLSSVMQAAFIDPATTEKVRAVGAKYGLSSDYIDLLFKAAYSLYDPSVVRDLYFRKGKDTALAYKRMREHGFTDERIAEQMETWPAIPGISDLITMMVKEAFNESAVQRFGLDDEYPGIVEVWAEKQGLDKEWVKRYWRAHWQHASPQMGFEMLHRGIIDSETVAELLKVLDYPTFWLEKLIRLSYSPITRVDIRRIYQDGLITKNQLAERYRSIGYSPEDAKLLADWTEGEYGTEAKSATAKEVTSAYSKGFLQRKDTEEMLLKLAWSPERVRFTLDLSDQQRRTDAVEDMVKTILDGYLKGAYTEGQMRERLNRLEIPADQVENMVDLASTKREIAEEVSHNADEIAYREEMRRAERDAMKAAYRGGFVTADEALAGLVRLGFDRTLSEAWIAQWPSEPSASDKLPSRSDLDRFWRAKDLSDEEYIIYMKKLGYSDEFARKYLSALKKG